jgi:hypothetical protein
MPAGRHNPKGFFEHAASRRRLCDAFDEALGAPLAGASSLTAILRDWRHTLEEGGGELLGLKHPLLCFLGAQITEVFADDEVKFVVTDRNPHAIVASLGRCKWLWSRRADLFHVIARLCEARDSLLQCRSAIRVDFEEMMARPANTVQALIKFLNLSPRRANFAGACEFIDAKLATAGPYAGVADPGH